MRIPILRFATIVICLVLCSAPYQVQAAGFTLTSGTYTTLDLPDDPNGNTYASGINNRGQIVGTYYDRTSPWTTPNSSGFNHGYLYSGGSYTPFNVPGAPSTGPRGINDVGQIVGNTSTGNVGGGFLYSGGSYTPIGVPGGTGTIPWGINNSGQIVGFYNDAASARHGFLYSGGSFSTINVPGASYTTPVGINDAGQIVGTYYNGIGNIGSHGFLYSGGSFTTIDVPGGTGTNAFGINNRGQIVGYYYEPNITDGTGTHGFLYSGGSFTPIDFPAAPEEIFETFALGINDSGQIVGRYNAVPPNVPESSSLVLLGCGLVGLAAWRRKRAA